MTIHPLLAHSLLLVVADTRENTDANFTAQEAVNSVRADLTEEDLLGEDKELDDAYRIVMAASEHAIAVTLTEISEQL